MSINKASETWDMLEPFAQRWLEGVMGDGKSGDPARDGYFIILYDESGQVKREYSFSEDGLRAALAAAESGDVVWMPAGTVIITGSEVYVSGTELATGVIDPTGTAGIEITGLVPGQLYAVELTGGPVDIDADATPWPPNTQLSYAFQAKEPGGSFAGKIGATTTDGTNYSNNLTMPSWGAYAEMIDTYRARLYFQATGTSIFVRTWDAADELYWDNSGTIGYRLRSATMATGITIPEGVEVVGLGKNSILDGNIENSGKLTLLTVTGIVAGDGEYLIYDTSGRLVTNTQIQSNAANDTAPFVVGSAIVVTNLNADLLDGYDAEDLLNEGSLNGNDETTWLEGYAYRIKVTINNTNEENLANYQVPVDINTLPLIESGKILTDFKDMRATAEDGESLLDMYRENEAGAFNESNFARYESNPIIGTGFAWEDIWVHPYSIIEAEDGSFYMFYGGAGGWDPEKVGLATSPDGVTWTKYSGNPIFGYGTSGQWDDAQIAHFQVIHEGNTWKAWYAGRRAGDPRRWQIGYATSNDGITWTRYASNPVLSYGGGSDWDSEWVIPSCILREGDTYYMFYWGSSDGSTQSTWKIGLATSSDGISWTKHGSNPVLAGNANAWENGILDADVVKIGSTYYMFYQGNTSDFNYSCINLASSSDMVNWTRFDDNPLARGSNGEWDDQWNEGPVLLRMANKWMMYYMGAPDQTSSTARQIGLMEFPDTRLWVTVPFIPANGETTIYIYYGNSNAVDASAGSAGTGESVSVENGEEQTRNAYWDTNLPAQHARDLADMEPKHHVPAPTGTDKAIQSDATGKFWEVVDAPESPTSYNYRQFAYIVSGGDFSFIVDQNGKPVMVLQEFE